MTEAEWLSCTDPSALIEYLRGRSADRKIRLFAVACCRRIEHLLPQITARERVPDGQRAVAVAERYADGMATPEELLDAYWGAEKVTVEGERPFQEVAFRDANGLFDVHMAAFNELRDYADARFEKYRPSPDEPAQFTPESAAQWERLGVQESCAQASLLRDIFGNPFRSIACAPQWRTDTAIALARTMYESRDFSAMPILADALQDGGCDSAEVLDHCRGPGPHVRGCWVVDLVLGKE
jgi:hypothetical protein